MMNSINIQIDRYEWMHTVKPHLEKTSSAVVVMWKLIKFLRKFQSRLQFCYYSWAKETSARLSTSSYQRIRALHCGSSWIFISHAATIVGNAGGSLDGFLSGRLWSAGFLTILGYSTCRLKDKLTELNTTCWSKGSHAQKRAVTARALD